MKLLIITDAWHPQLNGVVRTCENLRKTLQSQDHDVKIVSPADFPIRIPMLGYHEIELALFPHSRLKRIIQDDKPDNIHLPTEGPLGWATRKYCIRHNIPFTTSYHTQFPDYIAKRAENIIPGLYTPAHNLAKKHIRRFHAKSSAMMVATQSLENTLKDWGFQTPMHRMTRGVNTALFHPGERTEFKDLPRPIALYVGRIAIEKSIEDFLDMPWDGSKVIIGEGPDRAALEKQYPTAIFTGKKTNEDLAAHYRSADLFVFPSRTDTFGVVLIEALASGLPIAAYNVTGPKDIITKPALGALDNDLGTAAQNALQSGTAKQRAEHIKRNYTWDKATEQFFTTLSKHTIQWDIMQDTHTTPHSYRQKLAGCSLAFILLSATLKIFTPLPILPIIAACAIGLYACVLVLAAIKSDQIKAEQPKRRQKKNDALISVLIPAKNEESVIGDTIRKMAEIKYPNLEIFIIDDASADNTNTHAKQAIKAAKAKHPDCKITLLSRTPGGAIGKSAVLNFALQKGKGQKAKGDIIAVFDADARMDKNFIQIMANHFTDETIMACQSRKAISNANDNWLAQCQNIEYAFDAFLQNGRMHLGSAVELRGNAQFIRKTALDELGGFNENTITDDLDLSTQLHMNGKTIAFSHETAVYEEAVLDLGTLIKQRKRWAEGALKRYLDYLPGLFQKHTVKTHQKADILLYCINFILPIMLFLELAISPITSLLPGQSIASTASTIALIAACIWALSIPGILMTLQLTNKASDITTLAKQAVIVSLYLLFLWFPLVAATYLRILLTPDKGINWYKTERKTDKIKKENTDG